MPGFGTTGRTRNNADRLMDLLGTSRREADIRQMSLDQMRAIGHAPFGIPLDGLTVEALTDKLVSLPHDERHDLTFENTQARLIGVACSLWDKDGKAAREVVTALEGTELPLMRTRIPMSRRVPSSTLAKRPVVLSAPTSPVAVAYAELADDVLAAYGRLPR